ncbi:MAG: TRAP transporter substrate-binding protein [Alphaproteobacteria bacterium]|nr:TRAP transporter substrate-binding protein [Alphaproteobacteria bacterium]
MADRVLRFGGYQGPASVHTRGLRVIERELAGTPGLKVEIVENVTAAGRKAGELASMVETGELVLAYVAASYLVGRVPEVALLDLPFTFTDRAKIWPSLDAGFGPRLAELFAAQGGLRLVALWDNGFRHLTSGVRMVRTPEDAAGQRIRTMPTDVAKKLFSAMGFTPIPLDVAEFPSAMAAGRLDAQENPLTNSWGFNVYKYQKYFTQSAHLFGVTAVFTSAALLAELTPEQRRRFEVAIAVATKAQREFAAAEDAALRDRLLAEGVQFHELTVVERARFATATAALAAEIKASFPRDLVALLPAS